MTDPIDRNGQKRNRPRYRFSLDFSPVLTFGLWKGRTIDYECCHFVPRALYRWRHEHGPNVWQSTCQINLKPILFCSSLTSSKPVWQRLVNSIRSRKNTSSVWILHILSTALDGNFRTNHTFQITLHQFKIQITQNTSLSNPLLQHQKPTTYQFINAHVSVSIYNQYEQGDLFYSTGPLGKLH